MKEKVRKEYLRRTSKLLETKFSSRNLIKKYIPGKFFKHVNEQSLIP